MPRLAWKQFEYWTEGKQKIIAEVTVDSFRIFRWDTNHLVHDHCWYIWDYNRSYELMDKFVRQNFAIWYDDNKDLTLPHTIDKRKTKKKVMPSIDDMYKEIASNPEANEDFICNKI